MISDDYVYAEFDEEETIPNGDELSWQRNKY